MKNGIASILVEFVQTWGIATLNTSHLMGYINNIYIYVYIYILYIPTSDKYIIFYNDAFAPTNATILGHSWLKKAPERDASRTSKGIPTWTRIPWESSSSISPQLG